MDRLKVNTETDSGPEYRDVRPGRKLAHAVGMSRWEASTGTQMLSVGFVVLRDAEQGGDDTGLIFMERFALTPAASFRIARWAKATGFAGDFYPDDDEAIQRIMARGPVVATLVEDTYKGKTRAQVESFAPYSGQADPAWDAAVLAGEQEFAAIQQRMADSRSNGGGTSPMPAPQGNGVQARPHDDIPF
jgi:hypothetical protein